MGHEIPDSDSLKRNTAENFLLMYCTSSNPFENCSCHSEAIICAIRILVNIGSVWFGLVQFSMNEIEVEAREKKKKEENYCKTPAALE